MFEFRFELAALFDLQNLCDYASGTVRSSGAPDANLPLIRRLWNAIQLTNARHYHDSDLSGTGENGNASRLNSSGDYRKITVRESLASLRARNALPPVDQIPSPTGPEYERVYGAPGESNSSTTYEVVPGPRGSVTDSFEFEHARTGFTNHSDEISASQSKRFSDIYSEIPCECSTVLHLFSFVLVLSLFLGIFFQNCDVLSVKLPASSPLQRFVCLSFGLEAFLLGNCFVPRSIPLLVIYGF
ncbi:unnamed protein product [Echinostoma caproni]|uniref:Uncharacterized protein n=1 Tax=Echinostoma caproni TaxID=27848 RepID=A0A183B9U5_9TREM|nr:unnamed protein product [Echinostoma caproni]